MRSVYYEMLLANKVDLTEFGGKVVLYAEGNENPSVFSRTNVKITKTGSIKIQEV